MSGTKEVEPIELSHEAWDAADKIRVLAGLSTVEDAIRRALGDELYLQQRLQEGYTIIVSKGDEYWELDLSKRR